MFDRTIAAASAIKSETNALYDIVEELTQCLQRREAVDFEKVIADHPEHAERLRQILPALEILADLGSAVGSDALAISASVCGASSNEETRGTLGDFQIHREIGRGGMGVVYEAEQISLGRRVALKVLPLAGMLDPRRLQRFKNEARAAAGLHHPGIVPVYAVGCERGVHYYAMQYIEGRTLAQVIGELRGERNADRKSSIIDQEDVLSTIHDLRSTSLTSLSTIHQKRDSCRTIAEWGVQIAEALEYAHSVGVIHRDIKPANLILDGLGRVWITDFGLAQLETDAGLTMTGDVVGTLRYTSPEQALGERGLVDQRSDVYSLGLTLYELLTRTAAFPQTDRRELLNRIANEDPVPVRRIAPSIPVELETIVQKAIEKEPAARYATARELAEDLRRFLRELPIHARRAKRVDRARKWARRNRGIVRTATAFAVATALAVGVAAFLIDRERQQARLERLTHVAEQKQADTAHENLRIHQYVTSINLAERDWRTGRFHEARRHLRECLPAAGRDDLRSFEWHYLWNETRDIPAAIGNHRGPAYCASISPDRRLLATGGDDGVRVWDLLTGNAIIHLSSYIADVNGVAFSPDGRWLATASEDPDVRIWRTADWQLERTIPYPREVVSVAFTPDGQTLAVGERREIEPSGADTDRGIASLLQTTNWEPRHVLRGHTALLQSLAISDDGRFLATGSDDRTACLWNVQTGSLVSRIVNGTSPDAAAGVKCVAFAHRQPLVATVGQDGAVRLWSTADGMPVTTLATEQGELESVVFSPDDSLLVVGGDSARASVWRLQGDGSYVRHQFLDSSSGLWSTTFLTADTFVTTSNDGAVRRWNARQLHGRRRLHCSPPESPDFAFVRNGQALAIGTIPIEIHSLAGDWTRRTIAAPGPMIRSVAVAPDGRSLLAIIEGRVWCLRDCDHPRPEWTKLVDYGVDGGPVTDIGFLGPGCPFSVRYSFRVMPVYCDPVSGAIVASPIESEKPLDRFLTSAHGTTRVIIRGSGQIEVYDTKRLLWKVEGPGPVWRHATMSADGRRLAVTRNDGTIHVWEISQPDLTFVFTADSKPLASLEFFPDGRTLSGCTNDNRIRLWNVATGRELLTLEAGLSGVRKVAVAPNGSALAASGRGLSGEEETLVWLAAPEVESSSDAPAVDSAVQRPAE